MLSPSLAAKILSQLGENAALLQDGQTLYYSLGDQPIARLIQGIYDLKPEHARRILRARIYGASPPSEMELAMVKVAAKRATAPLLPSAPGNHAAAEPGFRLIEVKPQPPPPLLAPADLPREILELLEKKEFMRAALALSEQIPKKSLLYESDRRVAALLVGRDDRLLAAAVNSNAKNRTRHAESNLVQSFIGAENPALRPAIPRGSRVYVTLKCCKMCAAMIWCAAEDVSDLRVCYAQDDPGPNARSTVFTLSSFERKRASRSERELSAEIEFHQPA